MTVASLLNISISNHRSTLSLQVGCVLRNLLVDQNAFPSYFFGLTRGIWHNHDVPSVQTLLNSFV